MTTYYEEVREVLDDEGCSDEVPDVDAGFREEAGLPGLPVTELRAAVSWKSKGELSD